MFYTEGAETVGHGAFLFPAVRDSQSNIVGNMPSVSGRNTSRQPSQQRLAAHGGHFAMATKTCRYCKQVFSLFPSRVSYTVYCSKKCRSADAADYHVNMERIAERFWSYVDKSGGPDACWPWTGARIAGYGVYGAGKRGRVRAARFACELVGKKIPNDLLACHKCDNPPCCNPCHIFAGTSLDNNRDMVRKGRAADFRGEKCGHAKLTEDDVRRIRAEYASGNIFQEELAERYGVSEGAISGILRRKNWKHVS